VSVGVCRSKRRSQMVCLCCLPPLWQSLLSTVVRCTGLQVVVRLMHLADMQSRKTPHLPVSVCCGQLMLDLPCAASSLKCCVSLVA
jgi:hypothetical protein